MCRIRMLLTSIPTTELGLNDFFVSLLCEQQSDTFLFDRFRELIEDALSLPSSFPLFQTFQAFFNFFTFFLNKMATAEEFRKGDGLGKMKKKIIIIIDPKKKFAARLCVSLSNHLVSFYQKQAIIPATTLESTIEALFRVAVEVRFGKQSYNCFVWF